MKGRYLYMKFLGLLLVLTGFSYSLTSFNNFFSYIFKTKIFPENLNIYMISSGLIIPLFIFIFGVFFYFYTDYNINKINKFIFISYVLLLIIGITMIVFSNKSFLNINQIFEFIHISLSYIMIVLSLMGIFGCIKYKY